MKHNRGKAVGRLFAWTTLVMLGVAGAALWSPWERSGPSSVAVASVEQGEFVVRSVYTGKLESRNVVTIMSRFQGPATVVELAREGTVVSKGDLLVRFDSAKLERELVKLEKDHALARSEVETLRRATLPLELRELELALREARDELSAQQQYLEDSLLLHEDNLISEQEISEQRRKVNSQESKVVKLEMELGLTRKYLHPSKLERAITNEVSARQELELARRQLQATTVVAPADGVVVYKPLNIGGEFRTVRVGDSLYPNQPFMVIPDMTDVVVHCDIPESELSRVEKGRQAFIQPLAYPDVTLDGTVEHISSIAQNLPGQPVWQKYFHVVIAMDEVHPRVRPGMSVTAHILTHYREAATLIPRRAVSWDQGRALTKIVIGDRHETRELTLGLANDMYYEVLSGIEQGEKVVVR